MADASKKVAVLANSRAIAVLRIENQESSGRCCADFEEEEEADVIGATCL
jgi:hypothetical protein